METLAAVFFITVVVLNAISFFGHSKTSSEELYNKSVLDTKFNRDLHKNA